MGDLFCFQRTLPLEGWDMEDEGSPIASNGLLTALRGATGTTLVQYSMSDVASQDSDFDLSAGENGLAKGAAIAEKLLTVEAYTDATQMLQEFRAIQWDVMAMLWFAAGHSFPPLLERAAEILGRVPTDWESVRRVEYFGIACKDAARTLADSREARDFVIDPGDPTLLFNSLAAMCDIELHEGAKAAEVALSRVGDATGFMNESVADAWAARVLSEMNPLRATVAIVPRKRPVETRWPRRSR